jgi:hypothetical protein
MMGECQAALPAYWSSIPVAASTLVVMSVSDEVSSVRPTLSKRGVEVSRYVSRRVASEWMDFLKLFCTGVRMTVEAGPAYTFDVWRRLFQARMRVLAAPYRD